MCSFGDLDPCQVWRETPKVVARPRKPRNCDGCGTLIAGGVPFIDHFNVFDGEASHEAMCFACWWTREEFAEAHDGNLFPPGALRNNLHECIGENDDEDDVWRPHLAALLTRYRHSPRGRAFERIWRRYGT